MRTHLGFSLMELIIVMAIIAILVTVAIPSFQIYTRRAHYTEIIEGMLPYRIGVEECFALTGGLSHCQNNQNGVPPTLTYPSSSNHLIHNIAVNTHGVITATPSNRYGILSKDTYILTPHIDENHLIWHSSGGAVAAGYAH